MNELPFRQELLRRLKNEAMRPMIEGRPRPDRWYSIANQEGPIAEIRLYDEIGWFGVTAADFATELDAITADKIMVAINSIGGDVFDGIAIYNSLRLKDAHVTTRVDSLAASIASVIAQAGDNRQMITASQMMIHEAWGLTIGNAADHRKTAEVLDQNTDVIAAIFAERSGKDVAEFRSLMEAETWFKDSEAVEAGLADELIKPVRRKADDSTHPKFSERARAVVTEVEQLVAETEKVVAFRSEQGKPPLSEDSVEIFERFKAAHQRLADVVTSEPPPDPDSGLITDVDAEFARFVDNYTRSYL